MHLFSVRIGEVDKSILIRVCALTVVLLILVGEDGNEYVLVNITVNQ